MSESLKPFSMPKWGLTMTEGTLIEWFAEEGDEVAIGDEIAEVETDKMTSGVEAQYPGRLLRKVASEGEVVPVGGLLGVIGDRQVDEEELAAFIATAAETLEVAEPEVDQGPQAIFVPVELGAMHALAQGEGEETVVFLHGFGGDALNWQFAMERAAIDEAMVAIDMPGHGESTKNVGDGSPAILAAEVRELLDQRGLDRIHLVGHSLGGLIAVLLAAEGRERVASLTLVAPAGLGDEINSDFLTAFATATTRRDLKAAMGNLFADQRQVSRRLVEETLRYKRLEGVPEALAALAAQLAESGRQKVQVAELLGSLTVPVLVVWGSEDQVIPAAHAAAAPPSARVEILDGIGHSPHVEAPDRFHALLAEHIRGAGADARQQSSNAAGGHR
jgi:pyruvate dehydrogenase E2 component (dihydrolipoamide acetyltransferase)